MELLPGFVIFGIGVGLMLAQLTNITLSAVKGRERGEASGVSETAKGLGTSLGTAIIGSVLVAALLSGLVSGVQQSDILDDSLKGEISKGLKDNTMHMKEEDIEKELHKLPKESLDELGVILNNAFVKSLKFCFDAILVCSVLCLIISFFLSKDKLSS